jgi:NitT/TauT family transport system permease protein
MTVEAQTPPAALDGLSEDRERAQKVATGRRRRRQLQEIGIRLVSLTVVLGLWQYFGARIDPVLFTTPWAIAKAAVVMIGSGELWNYLWPSLVVLALGLTAAAAIGITMGLLLARFWVLDVALGVYITFLYSTPTVALVPLIVLWAGFETKAKVIILFLPRSFPWSSTPIRGQERDPRLIEVGRAFRCSERQLWTNIVLPGALPFIVTGLRLAVGRGLIGMVLADLYTAISGIGYLIVRTASTIRSTRCSCRSTLGVLGVTLTALLRLLELKVAPWTAAGQSD